jgi:hypothetical protein
MGPSLAALRAAMMSAYLAGFCRGAASRKKAGRRQGGAGGRTERESGALGQPCAASFDL